LAVNDGQNFLRMAHPAPLDIRYWEIGNEVFGNGYYGSLYEEDLHFPSYTEPRQGQPALSPTTYGRGVLDYVAAMKAVDPSIRVGAVLNTPPMDYSWGPDWNQRVLTECGHAIDFVIVHWYPGANGSISGLVAAPASEIPAMHQELRRMMQEIVGERAESIEITMTELGGNDALGGLPARCPHALGIFATDGYATALEYGFVNLDWLELHKSSFLDEHSQAKGPAFRAIQLAHQLAAPGDVMVRANSEAAKIRVHAALRADGTLGILLINTDPNAAVEAAWTITGGRVGRAGSRWDYLGPLEGDDGDVAGPTSVDGLGNQYSFVLEPYSVVEFALPVTL
jgi:hypothetical protein